MTADKLQTRSFAHQLFLVLMPQWKKRDKSQGEDKNLQDQVASTYSNLRYGIAVIGVALPFLLPLIGKFWYGISFQDSMSAYYWAGSTVEGPIRSWISGISFFKYILFFLAGLDGDAPMRSWFVGILFVLGVFLYLYKGFSRLENILLNIAGLCALGVALFPMEWTCGDNCRLFTFHGGFAALLFICIALVALLCSRQTLDKLPLQDETKTRAYRSWYYGLGIFMFSFPFLAWFITNWIINDKRKYIFWVECLGILAFALYWWIKSNELSEKRAEIHIIKRGPALSSDNSSVQTGYSLAAAQKPALEDDPKVSPNPGFQSSQ
jgi:hypothetical protein